MNFLAHLYLSGNHEDIMVGNFIGDYVKGKEYLYYHEPIRKGIMLHRYIDSFTDSHPITKISRSHIAPEYGKYSGIIIDIFYDYFLSSTWNTYSPVDLEVYVDYVFATLKKHYYDFPQGIKNWFPNFIRNNWLLSYSSIEGIEDVLHRMSSRTSLPEHTSFAISVLRENEAEMRKEFVEFFESIRGFVDTKHGIVTGLPLVTPDTKTLL
jgi:acyl carrier protein phosphodiesterase